MNYNNQHRRWPLVLLLFVSCFFWTVQLRSQDVIINEVNQAGQWVELYNASTTATTNVEDWFLCDFPSYDRISSAQVTIISGSTLMTPGSYLVLGWTDIYNTNNGEIGLYLNTTTNFGDATKIKDYMQYGSGNHTRAGLAVGQGLWDNASSFVANVTTSGNSLVMTDETAMGPSDTDSGDWAEGPATQGSTNFPIPPLLIVNDNPIPPGSYVAEVIESAGRVADNGTQEVVFRAVNEIRLFANFTVDSGGRFNAEIQ